MKTENTPKQSFSDKQPKAIVKVIAGCLVIMLVGGSFGYAYIQKQKNNVQTEAVTIEDNEVAAGITEEVMKAVEQRLITYTDENGNTVELTEEDMESLQTLCTAEILQTLKGTDLMNLTNEQLQQLVTSLKKKIMRKLQNISLSHLQRSLVLFRSRSRRISRHQNNVILFRIIQLMT